jgi:ferredoxin
MGKIEVYYFSGTGNTIYILNQLRARIPEITMIPVASLLLVKNYIMPKSKTIGFCFPNHAGHLPIPMKRLIDKLVLQEDEYLFALCTSAFSKSFAPKDIDRLLRKNNCWLSLYANMLMPDNHTMVSREYRLPSKEELKRCESQVQAKLDQIKDLIKTKEIYIEKDDRAAPFPLLIDKVLRPLMFYLIEKHPSTVLRGALYADLKCTGCTICEKVCPADRIRVTDGKPTFDHKKTCYGCYACVNFCPAEAIQVGSKWYNGRSYTSENGRYPHPYASVNDIANQKRKKI